MVHVHRNESTLCADVWHTGAPDSSTDTLNKRYTSTPINSRSHACKHISYTYTRLATRNPHTHQHTPIRKCSAIGVTVVLLRFHSLFSQIFIYCLEVGTCSSPFSQKKKRKKNNTKRKKENCIHPILLHREIFLFDLIRIRIPKINSVQLFLFCLLCAWKRPRFSLSLYIATSFRQRCYFFNLSQTFLLRFEVRFLPTLNVHLILFSLVRLKRQYS